MFVYRIIATYRDGEEVYRHINTHTSLASAERQVQIEIIAYTYQGVCEWTFELEKEWQTLEDFDDEMGYFAKTVDK
jgi:hypothetical protein